jgi:adenylate kinase family enzyme
MYFSMGLSFLLQTEEKEAIGARDLRHITSTATAYSSLGGCPEGFRFANPADARCRTDAKDLGVEKLTIEERSKEFADGILKMEVGKWTSDESAQVYCECRALPFAIENASEWNDSIAGHLRHVLEQLDPATNDGRLAVGEAAQGRPQDEWYPPNAYHTYWALKALAGCSKRFKAQFEQLNKELRLNTKITNMRQWARQVLAFQTALHAAGSSTLDSDQLAWALAIICSDPNSDLTLLREQDFLREALRCLFSTQTDVGTWRHYAPLFHYRKSGNAYCYVFETFAALLECALEPNATFLRTALKERGDGLLRLWNYANATRQSPNGNSSVLLWSSGHRLNQHWPESWATASVFQYAQALRRLVGIWTREEAIKQLPAADPRFSAHIARERLVQRSETWTMGSGLTDRLFSLFIYPRDIDSESASNLEPDSQPIREEFARSAILFGPAGASKTTMVRFLAASIGWQYVELHSSHFVTDGLSNVQKTADRIFQRLYELDRAVILFDEVDELVREREIEGESSGRFLTTSMLPKLAELWDGRRVLYFVATNHIEFFDRAITRAQRFDAVWFVSPPSFQAKVTELKRLIKSRINRDVNINTAKQEVDSAVDRLVKRFGGNHGSKAVAATEALAKLVLLRWDELPELALRICEQLHGDAQSIDTDTLRQALSLVNDGQWRTAREYVKYIEEQKYQRRDYGKRNIWKVVDSDSAALNQSGIIGKGEQKYFDLAAEDCSELSLSGFNVYRVGPGTITLTPVARKKSRGTSATLLEEAKTAKKKKRTAGGSPRA